ncbi:MAG: methyltransferase domain-containing protein [Armatimonadetes bacterium]|nr:methyltransferase domain-containing protein [Armatimonadota bacterium]MBS1727661.1 methyltransferase domain-containing protein [Armatimonadota bacterium]
MQTNQDRSIGGSVLPHNNTSHKPFSGELLLDGPLPTPGRRHAVQFPRTDNHRLDQDEAYFYLVEDGERKRIRFHDYGEIYRRKGLYEQLFYSRLKCSSPKRMAEWLSKACIEAGEPMQTMRVLDLGAGNGMMAEALQAYGVARIVGVDILPEAKLAADRDRAGVYDTYYVADLTAPGTKLQSELEEWEFDCLTTIAALGFGDIPPAAFINCYNLVRDGGWVCFNIKTSFMSEADQTGFSTLIRRMMLNEAIEIHRMIRYRHRFSIDGEPLSYYGIVGRKRGDIPETDYVSIA